MDRKTLILLLIAVGLIIGILVVFLNPKKSLLSTPQTNKSETIVQVSPSKTLKSYTDQSGFTFSYPDNLSLVNNDPKDSSTYADIQLTSKGVDGSLSIKITDSKFTSLDEWVKTTNSKSPKEVKLGTLKAQEITTGDKVLLGALDQGVLFTIETPLGQNKDFWMSVHDKVLSDFSFAPPSTSQGGSGSSDGVTFEGEEVVQ